MIGSDFTERSPSENVIMVERSEDIFSAFSEITQVTGGISTTSANAVEAFKTAVDAPENYYLFYHKPADYVVDGKFHEINVKVKSGNYRVTFRGGYISQQNERYQSSSLRFVLQQRQEIDFLFDSLVFRA